MKQIPHYLIIGNGRVSRHMQHYLKSLGLPLRVWSRDLAHDALFDALSCSTHILILITDGAIDEFIQQHGLQQYNKILVHFSGCHHSTYAYSAHPLQTFSHQLYTKQDYEVIPFVTDKGGKSFAELLPGLANPSYAIDTKNKAYYHALCVVANNFTAIIWHKFFLKFSESFNIDKQACLPLLERTLINIRDGGSDTMTGPLVRHDVKTMAENMQALAHDDFYAVYEAFSKMSLEDLCDAVSA